MTRPRVLVVGCGFGGLAAVRALSRAAVEITLVDRTNHHLFQPLLYQVAAASLTAPAIAAPIRHILRREMARGNLTVLQAAVVAPTSARPSRAAACRAVAISAGRPVRDASMAACGQPLRTSPPTTAA